MGTTETAPSVEAFLVIDNQPIEQGIDGLKVHADAILDADVAEGAVTDQCDEFLRVKGFGE
jgi:hypothetical protein